MAITLKWHDPDETILILEFQATWTWLQLNEALQAAFQMTAQKTHDVYMVYMPCCSKARILPAGNPLPMMLNAGRQRPENLVMILAVQAPTLLHSLYEVYERIRSRPDLTCFVLSLDEALHSIEQYRQQKPTKEASRQAWERSHPSA